MLWLALLLALGTLAALAYPLFRGRFQAEPAEEDRALELAAAKETTYAAIKELEFDHQAGSLSLEDYQDLEASYKRKAASLLQALDSHQRETDQGARIEAEVRQLRSQLQAQRSIEEEVHQLRQQPAARFCTQCAAPSAPGDRFCSQCGHPLRQGGPP